MARGDRLVREGALVVLVALGMPGAVSAQSASPAASAAEQSRLVWQKVDDPDVAALPSSALLYEVAAGTPGIVAVAAAECGRDACVQPVWSSDGQDWEVPPDTLPGIPVDIAWGPAGFVLVVAEKARHVAYLSLDGRAWERVPITGMTARDEPFAAIATSDGYLLVGCAGVRRDSGCVEGKIWSSSDGRRWSAQVPEGADGVFLADAAAQPGRVVLLGVPIGEATSEGFILVSDGPGWTKVRLPLSAAMRTGALLASVVATPDGGFAVLGDYFVRKGGGERAFLLTSPDGSTWHAEKPGPRARGSISTLASPGGDSGPGIAMLPGRLGFAPDDAVDTQFLSWTPDGQRWDMSVLSLEPYGGARVEDIAQTADGGLIAVGLGAGEDFLPAIWRGSIVPSGPPAGPVGGEPPPATRPKFTSDRLAYLLAHAPDATRCAPIAQKEVRSRHPEAVAAIQCAGPGAIDTVRYYLFPTAERMADWWAKTLGRADAAGLEPASGSFESCAAGIPGETGWQAGLLTGRVDCYRESGTGSLARKQFANARWTDDTQLIGAWAVGSDDDLGALFAEFAAGRTEAP